LLKTHDSIVKELKEVKNKSVLRENNNVEVQKNTSSPSNHTADNYTRVRLVQFPKNPNEPMVIVYYVMLGFVLILSYHFEILLLRNNIYRLINQSDRIILFLYVFQGNTSYHNRTLIG